MLYRKFGQTNEKISALGFGCMRLPIIDGDTSKIDEEKAKAMLRYAVDNGVNYVDTAYGYHGGQSEYLVGKALRDGYREKVYLATKLPSWLVKSREDMDRLLNEQLQRLQTDHIDFYLVHNINRGFWENLKRHNIFEFLDSVLSDGRVKYVGFSFHDGVDLFKEVVDSYNWTFCQIQYNYLDENYQAGKEGLDYAANKGLGVIVMEPLRGGKLATNIPDDIKAIWDKGDIKRSPAEWGLKFVWDNKNVGPVLSGMSEMEQVKENLRIANQAYPESLTEKEKGLIDEVKKLYNQRIRVNCTNCKYCMPCPQGVDIPGSFVHLNNASIFNDIEGSKNAYNFSVKGNERASKCVECGKCEEACPQFIPIRDMLKEVVNILE